ncbi:E3 ubiquitin-protein ligase MIB2 [Strongylocentrotus purpuratus]|uniref:Uncharacterized protein n=1 Tax=Strongylocentrotus purpuratus TaxID=7668 RepID=A0A7M7SZP9_STRPU|nr:E3 ubiquitin-protein ligase MIB2 [Strongylocentrotus purpuratus]
MLTYIGERVVRGPDWEYNDDDGGDGCVGTVIAIKEERSGHSRSNETARTNWKVQKVTVAWDLGHIGDYRTGLDGKYDLACMDVGLGRPHLLIECDVCSRYPVRYRWLCAVCKSFDLCDACYNKNEHHLDHQFVRFSSPIGSCVRAPTRESSLNNRVEARGLFVGAEVSKDGKQGIVVETLRYELQWGGVKVLWPWEGGEVTRHTLEDGVIDIKCEEAAKYGLYYKDHLANFGERTLCLGDMASVLVDVDEIKQLQEEHGDWMPQMTDSLRQVATIIAVTYNGDCKLHFPVLDLGWDFNTEAVTRVGY